MGYADRNGKSQITVNAICPGYTETEIVSNAIANINKSDKSEAEARAILMGAKPQYRLVQPEEGAAAVSWLCLPSSRAVTNQSIVVAGGEVIQLNATGLARTTIPAQTKTADLIP